MANGPKYHFLPRSQGYDQRPVSFRLVLTHRTAFCFILTTVACLPLESSSTDAGLIHTTGEILIAMPVLAYGTNLVSDDSGRVSRNSLLLMRNPVLAMQPYSFYKTLVLALEPRLRRKRLWS